MAEDVREQTPAVPAPSSEPLVERPPAAREQRAAYGLRFGLAYLVLAVVAGVAIGAAVLLLGRPGKEAAPEWSRWKPTGSTSTIPREIARYVSGRYRLPSGNPLVAVLAGTPRIQAGEQAVGIRAVAIRNDPEGAPNDVRIVPTDSGVMYELCGLGPSCSIGEGRPSRKRHQLLRREALELALYTFKYVDDSDSVIALLPQNPQAQQAPATALFFQRSELERELDQPLERTLRRPDPPQAAEIGQLEGSIIDRLTQPRLFTYEFQAAPAGGAILVLAPLTG